MKVWIHETFRAVLALLQQKGLSGRSRAILMSHVIATDSFVVAKNFEICSSVRYSVLVVEEQVALSDERCTVRSFFHIGRLAPILFSIMCLRVQHRSRTALAERKV